MGCMYVSHSYCQQVPFEIETGFNRSSIGGYVIGNKGVPEILVEACFLYMRTPGITPPITEQNIVTKENILSYFTYKDFSYSIAESNWVRSGQGQYYYNIPNSYISNHVLSCAINTWGSTAGHVEASYYDNQYIQLRSNIATPAEGSVRVHYINV